MLQKIFYKSLNFIERHFIYFLLVITIIKYLISTFLFGFDAVLDKDSQDYMDLAIRLQNLNFEGYQFERTPGYPLLIMLLGMNLKYVLFFQYVLSFFTSVLLYKISKSILENKILAMVIPVFSSLLITNFFYERALLTETLSLFLFISVVYFFCVKKDSISNFTLTGILCAVLMLTRTLFVYLAPLVIFVFLIEKRKESLHYLGKRVLLLLTPTFLCFVLWCGMNKYHTGNFSMTNYFGINLAQTTVSFFDQYKGDKTKIKDIYVKYIQESDKDDSNLQKHAIWEAYEELKLETGYELPELSNVLSAMSKDLIIHNFDKYLIQIYVSLKDFWVHGFYWFHESDTMHTNKTYLSWLRTSRRVQNRLHMLFILSFVYYSFKTIFYKERKNRLITFLLLAIMTASILQAMVVYGDNARFSYPFYSMIILICVYFVKDIIQLINSKVLKS